jgi:pilus assembly protein CpaE
MAKPMDRGDREFSGTAPHERPVPRIAMHAFCESSENQAALQLAAEDRRLAKATLKIELGGISAAVQHYTGQITPNLLIVETALHGAEALAEIDRLAEVCDPATKVIVIGRANDVELYRELMRRGVSEYLVGPVQPLHLIETVSGLYLDPDGAPIGRVISFIAARGGAGASTISHNIAWYIAEQLAINTVLVDLDLPFGTASLNFDEEPGQGVADALAAPERLDEVLLDRVLQKVGERLSLFSAPAMLEREYETAPEAFTAVIDAVRAIAPCVVLDLPHVWSPWVRQILLHSDDIVIVATPDLPALRNTRAMCELLRQSRRNDSPPKLILNQDGIPKRPQIPIKDFGQTLELSPSLVLPFEPALFGSASNNGQMVFESQPNAAVSLALAQLAGALTGRGGVPLAKAANPLLSLLMGRKRA